jgi:hypothetical protein
VLVAEHLSPVIHRESLPRSEKAESPRGSYPIAMLTGLKLWWKMHRRATGSHWLISAVCCIPMLLLAMCSGVSAQTGTAWPEADKLFHSDPRWLGADAAFSIDLGRGRVLWLFGDTFVARKPGDSRASAAFVRNTVAVQTGYGPSHASMKFYWRTRGAEPSEIFPSEGQVWKWPASGIRIGRTLIVFCTRLVPDSAKNSLGFKLAGWEAYQVDNPDEEPSAWTLKKIAEDPGNMILATAALREGGQVYLLGASEPEHDLYLARWSVEAARLGQLDGLEWWTGSDWQAAPSKRRPLMRAVGTESSLQRDPRGGFLEINSQGFGATDIVMRHAPRLEGPWCEPQIIYRPPESDAHDAFVYAGKSHPELRGADLIVTYAANGDDKKVAADMSLYFPRFVRVELPKHSSTTAK